MPNLPGPIPSGEPIPYKAPPPSQAAIEKAYADYWKVHGNPDTSTALSQMIAGLGSPTRPAKYADTPVEKFSTPSWGTMTPAEQAKWKANADASGLPFFQAMMNAIPVVAGRAPAKGITREAERPGERTEPYGYLNEPFSGRPSVFAPQSYVDKAAAQKQALKAYPTMNASITPTGSMNFNPKLPVKPDYAAGLHTEGYAPVEQMYPSEYYGAVKGAFGRGPKDTGGPMPGGETGRL